MKFEEATSDTPFETSGTILFSPSTVVRLPPVSAYQEPKFRVMSRPTINKDALKAAFEAALNPEVREVAVPSQWDKKRGASESFEMPPAKLARVETEVCNYTLRCRTLLAIPAIALYGGSHLF